MKKDSPHKRFVPSMKVQSLHENMGLGKSEGYGDPHPSQDYLFDNLKNNRGGTMPKAPKSKGYPRGRVSMPRAKGK